MMNEKVFYLRYGDRSYCSLATELEQHKERADRAELDNDKLRTAFAFLLEQEWFQNHRHELSKHLQDNNTL